MDSSSEPEPEDSFATPNPKITRRDLPGYGFKQPKPLSTHTNQLNGWIMTEKPTAGPTPPTTGRSKLNQLHFSPQKGFRSSRKSGGGGGGSGGKGATSITDKDPNAGAWKLGRTEYTIQRDSPSFQRGRVRENNNNDAGELRIRSNITTTMNAKANVNVNTNSNMATTPVGTTRQPITPPDEAELDGMYSLRRDKGKGKATLSQMARGDRDLGAGTVSVEGEGEGEQEGRFGSRDRHEIGGGGGGGGFPEDVADSQDDDEADSNGHVDQEEEDEDIFRPKRSRRNPIPTSDYPIPVPVMDEMQESILFLGHRNATPSASTSRAKPNRRPSLGSASGSAPKPARTSQGPTVQTKLSEFLKPRDPSVGSVRPRPKRAAAKKKEVEAEVEAEEPAAEISIQAVTDDAARTSSSNSKKKNTARRSTIMEDRQGARRVLLNVESQDIVPDSQTLDTESWNRLPLDMNVEPDAVMTSGREADPPRDPRSDTGEDLDHPIEVFDESMVPQARPAILELRVPEPTVQTETSHEPSSDSSLRGESDDELHSLAYREQVRLDASRRQINRTSGTAQDDESYRPLGYVGVPIRGRRVPIGAGMRAKSGLRAMVMHEDDDDDEDAERSGASGKKQRALRSTRSKSRAKSTELRHISGSRRVNEEDPDTDTEQPVQRGAAGASDLADAARAATEKARLSRTTSGGSSHTSVTQGLDASSDLTPLPSEYEEEGPDILEVELPEELRLSPDHHNVRAIADDEEEEVTPRRPTRRMVRIESHEEHAPRDAVENDLDDGEIGEVTVIPETARMSEIYPTVDDLEMAFGSAPRNADETMPATFDMDVDDDVFAEDIPADVGVSTIPQSWAHEMQPSLLGQIVGSIGDRPEIVAPADDAPPNMSGMPHEARSTTPVPSNG